MSGNHKHSTVPEHMAFSHHRYAGWTIVRIRQDAAAIGPATSALYDLILDEHSRPKQGSAPVSASSGSPRPTGASAWTRKPRGRSTSAQRWQPCGGRLWQPKPPRMTLQWSLKLAVLL
jgi:hypothetical protein